MPALELAPGTDRIPGVDPIVLLKELVRIPSVNPMGRDAAGPEFLETRLTEFLMEFFSRQGIDCRRVEVAPGRANVIARLERPGARTTVLLDAHQDTVPTDGMTIDPFEPVVRDGRLYGRGACDVKGGLAAMLAAFARLAAERPPESANVVMSCTCDEEATSLGINQLVDGWKGDAPPCDLVPQRPDAAIIAEPTELDVVVAHRGATRWKIRTAGVACHSSEPANGVNAIYRMARLISHLEDYARRLPKLVPAHPLCGGATLSVGRIEGGTSVNTVPDWCTIEIDRRVIPGEDGLAAREDVGRFLRERLDFDFEMLQPWIAGQALSDEQNGPLADALLEHVAVVVGPRRKVGVPYGTHASRTAAAGVPSVVFGPGSIAQAHTKDEWIATAEVERAAEVYFRFCASGGTASAPA
jgi:acetylornithine deacetylase